LPPGPRRYLFARRNDGRPSMTSTQPKLTFNDGRSMPQMGFGLWQVPARETAELIVQAAEVGYRLFDSAALYGNEEGLGEGVRRCGRPRD